MVWFSSGQQVEEIEGESDLYESVEIFGKKFLHGELHSPEMKRIRV